MSELNKVLLAFSDDILKSAKRHLGGRRIGRNKSYGVSSGQLKRSLSYTIRVRGKDIQQVTFGARGKADEYAAFIHFGVNGTQKNQKAPFSYRFENPSRKHRAALKKWIKQKGIKARDEKGRFKKMSADSLAFVLGRAVKRKGIVGLRFYTKAYTAVSKRYKGEFTEALSKDISAMMKAKLGNITITN
jgi:hypothetical protein